MFLRHDDVRRICRDTETFTSATPFRVPIPPEHDIRPTAQLPIESDPPMHSAYRRLMDPHFSRPAVARHTDAIRARADELLAPAIASGRLRGGRPVRAAAVPSRPGAVARPAGVRGRSLAHVGHPGPRRRAPSRASAATPTSTTTSTTPSTPPWRPRVTTSSAISPARRVDGRSLTRDEMRRLRQPRLRRWPPDGRVRDDERAAPPRRRRRTTSRCSPESPSRIPAAIEELLRFMTPIAHLGRTTTVEVEVGEPCDPRRPARVDLLSPARIGMSPTFERRRRAASRSQAEPACGVRARPAHVRRRSDGATGVADRVGVRGRPMCVARACRRSATTPRRDRVRRRAAGLRHAGVALREARLNGSPSATGHWR